LIGASFLGVIAASIVSGAAKVNVPAVVIQAVGLAEVWRLGAGFRNGR
jgi:hypothetical protein